ncbi:hypothetical protein RM844_05155 [Streptomyces sp. DSM 44915]|uniref:DUF6199 domain-containing protein n=1 Tax=Streptomyces chisholmiae TaxID=3075540 RepID=A0ABU2JL19_9ACTN|nr:hypothetical protein [Streptomyces sp. DSM 44915]MDT0265676.1 hypothetical protein [Streptomyces sp. DSM 44915]
MPRGEGISVGVIMGVVSAGFLLAAVIGPRRLWWWLKAWSYRNPEQNEPSEAAFAVQRAAYVGFAIVSFMIAVNTA